MDDELRKRIAELEDLIVRLANRIYLAHEVLANLAKKKAYAQQKPSGDADHERRAE